MWMFFVDFIVVEIGDVFLIDFELFFIVKICVL